MLELKNRLPISGLNFRYLQGPSDYVQLAAVLTASQAADQIQRSVSADDLAQAFQHLSNCDPYRDLLIAEVGDQIVGYIRGWREDKPAVGRLYQHNGYLIPTWRHKGIGTVMLSWMEEHLRELARLHPPTPQQYFQVNVTQFQTNISVMLEKSGYQPVRYFYEMVRPNLNNIIATPLPDGLEVIPVQPEHYPIIWQAVEETSKDEWEYAASSPEAYDEWLNSPSFQPELWQVAWDTKTQQVIGHVLTFIHEAENIQFHRKRGYTEGIGVRQDWRHKGVATALIGRSLRAQQAVGMTESALVVDRANSSNAGHLYESCGFQVTKRDTVYRKSFD